VQSNDYEMIMHVFSEVDIVNEITLFSDKCSNKDYDKLESEFAKELETGRYVYKAHLSKFVQNPEKTRGDAPEAAAGSGEDSKNEVATETTVS